MLRGQDRSGGSAKKRRETVARWGYFLFENPAGGPTGFVGVALLLRLSAGKDADARTEHGLHLKQQEESCKSTAHLQIVIGGLNQRKAQRTWLAVALPRPLTIDWAVPKSRALQFASVVLLLGAAVGEPAWELGHAIAHAESAEHPHEASAPSANIDGSAPTIASVPEANGHGHPAFQHPVRPSPGQAVAWAALPATLLVLPLPMPMVRSSPAFGVSARASPRAGGTTQPRAPPLA